MMVNRIDKGAGAQTAGTLEEKSATHGSVDENKINIAATGGTGLSTAVKASVASTGLLAAWRWWLFPALLSLALALVFVDPFAGDWDALDYTVLAVQGRPSSMILGRTLFIYANHALWRIAHALFQLPPERAYLLFKYTVVALSPLVIIAWWQLARDLTNNVRAATIAVLLLALSPFYIIYSGQVMTEIPALLLIGCALRIHLKGLRRKSAWLVLSGAALLGLSVNVREASLLYAPWLVFAPLVCGWRLQRREVLLTARACLIFLVCAFGPFALLQLTNFDDYRASWRSWVELSRIESALHPVSLGNLWALLKFFFITSPLVLVAIPIAAYKEWKRSGWSPVLVLGLIGLFANLSLIVHYSVVLNGRYMLTGLPALTPLVASYFMRTETGRMKNVWRGFITCVLGILFVAIMAGYYAWPVGRVYLEERALAKDYRARLALMPRDAVIIAGGQTVAITYWRGIGAGDWEVIGSGSGWPGARLAAVIEEDLHAGRRIFVDSDPRWWLPVGWQQQEIQELVSIESRFRFRRVSDTIFEFRPMDDETAADRPHLERLLPSNRAL